MLRTKQPPAAGFVAGRTWGPTPGGRRWRWELAAKRGPFAVRAPSPAGPPSPPRLARWRAWPVPNFSSPPSVIFVRTFFKAPSGANSTFSDKT